MARVAKFTCIFLPYLLTIGAFICLTLVGLGMKYKSGVMQRFYFFDLNLVEFKNKIFQSSEAKLLLQGDLYDWYATGLWNSCYGQVSTNGTRVVVGCTAAHQRYWFNPFEAPGISEIITLLKVDMSSALNIYHRASTALFYLWVFSLVFVLVQALAGFTSLFGHGWGILVSMVTMFTALLTIAFATVSTVMFAILTDKINKAINGKIKFTSHIAIVGTTMQNTAWIAAGFALVAWVLWSISACCCWSRIWSDFDCSPCRPRKRHWEKGDSEERGNFLSMNEMRNNSSQSMLNKKR